VNKISRCGATGKKPACKSSRVVDGHSVCGHGKTNAGARGILVVHIRRDAGARGFLCGTFETNAVARRTRAGHFFRPCPVFFVVCPAGNRSVIVATVRMGVPRTKRPDVARPNPNCLPRFPVGFHATPAGKRQQTAPVSTRIEVPRPFHDTPPVIKPRLRFVWVIVLSWLVHEHRNRIAVPSSGDS
jgi:hypothetical protein